MESSSPFGCETCQLCSVALIESKPHQTVTIATTFTIQVGQSLPPFSQNFVTIVTTFLKLNPP